MLNDIPTHDQLVQEIDVSIEDLEIDTKLNASVASVSRDLLSASKGCAVLFGNETTQALRDGTNLTSDSVNATAMSLRYDDPLQGSDEAPGQISILQKALEISQTTRARISESKPDIAKHLLEREREISATIERMQASNATKTPLEKRESKEQLKFLAQRMVRQIADKRANGKICTGFTTDPTYEEADGKTSRIRYRKEDAIIKKAVPKARAEIEFKYSVNKNHPDFPNLPSLVRIGDFEDHEQIYLFSAPAEGEMPAYEFRIRKIVNSHYQETYFGTIKSGAGTNRQEIEFEITRSFYEALKEIRPQEYQILHKRRFFIDKTPDAMTTIDLLVLNGKKDFSAEVEFIGGKVPANYKKPTWTSEQRQDRKYAMVSIAKDGIDW